MGCGCSMQAEPNPDKTDVSHFSILRTIGKGGFGTVTAVEKLSEPLKGEIFAMKAMGKVSLLQSRNGLRIAWRERNVLRVVDSPFVPKLHFAFQDEGSLYLVMDFLPGGDISYLIKQRSRLTEEQAKFYAAEIALGMEELHNRRIVYRDLKPANVLLDKHGHSKITDFGIGSVLKKENNFMTKGDAGTPGYQSPEMLQGKKYKFEPDFFAYGVTLIQMITGKRPFRDNNDTLECKGIPRSWSNASPDARDLILKLLNPNPSSRLTNWSALKCHAFFNGIDWEKLARCEVDPPIVPDANKVNFPIECEMEALLLPEDHKRLRDQDRFKGYTYDGHKPIDKTTEPSAIVEMASGDVNATGAESLAVEDSETVASKIIEKPKSAEGQEDDVENSGNKRV